MSEAAETAQKHSVALNMRISPGVRERLDAQADRLDQTMTSAARIALVLGLEALERWRPADVGGTPRDPGWTD